MAKVLVFGTFDLLHKGHVSFLRQAAEQGKLHVVVAREVNVMRIKGFKPVDSEKDRLAAIRRLPFVHRAFLGNKVNIMKVVAAINPDVICLGYDQKDHGLRGFLKSRNIHAKVVRLKAYRPGKFKSSKLRREFSLNP